MGDVCAFIQKLRWVITYQNWITHQCLGIEFGPHRVFPIGWGRAASVVCDLHHQRGTKPRPLLSRLKNEGSFSLHPVRAEVLAAHTGAEGDEVVIVNSESGEVKTVLAGATEGMWHPNGVDTLVLAPDDSGVVQVWQVSANPTKSPRQLTSFEDGAQTLGAITHEQDRLFVSGGTKSQPALMLLDLP